MLAGVASGYDVRLSNVSPVHPSLEPPKHGSLPPYCSLENQDRYATPFNHNNLHGSPYCSRPALLGTQMLSLQAEEEKPLRFTDSPRHYLSNLPPRRRSSSTSNDELEYLTNADQTPSRYTSDYSYPNGDSCSCSNRDYNYPQCHDRMYVLCPDCNGIMGRYGSEYAYDNPNGIGSNCGTPRLRSRHKRTSSDISHRASPINVGGSNINPTFRLEDEPQSGPFSRINHGTEITHSRQSSFDSRATCDIGRFSRLRSSLKHSYQSGLNTSSNSTPPDSLTSDDSSYVSAKDGGSTSTTSRVRFSPILVDLPAKGDSQDHLSSQTRKCKQKHSFS